MAINANLKLDQGADFETKILITDKNDNPIDLTGYTGESKMRRHYSSANSFSFTVDMTEAANGVVNVTMPAANTGDIAAGRYVYDIELTSENNVVSRIIEGIVTVTGQVTR